MPLKNQKTPANPDDPSTTSPSTSPNAKVSKWELKWLFIWTIVTTLIVAVACGWMFYKTIDFDPSNKEYTEAWLEHRNDIQHYWYGVDSVGLAKPLTKGDMLRILKSQELVLDRQDVLVDDVRQETNNLINKMNGWLGFWIGIVALVGVFVPVALQFKLYRESKETEKELSGKILNSTKSCKADLEAQAREIIGRIREITFATLVRNFQNVFECPATQVQESRNVVLREILSKIKRRVEENIRLYCQRIEPSNGNNTETDYSDMDRISGNSCEDAVTEHELTVMLIQATNLINIIKRLSQHKNRNLDRMLLQITSLITDLNTPGVLQSSINSKLRDFCVSLRLLSIPD